MKTFRVDQRTHLEGEIINPQNLYQKKLDVCRKKVEEILEENRPIDKPLRGCILMLFEKFEDAKKHWAVLTNSKFYKTEVKEDDILHRGDYNKVEELFSNVSKADRAKIIAIEYWNSEMTFEPKIEIYVKSAIVEKIISNDENERKNAFGIKYGFLLKRHKNYIR